MAFVYLCFSLSFKTGVTPMYIYIEKSDNRIIRLRVKEDEIKESQKSVNKLMPICVQLIF